MYLYFYVLIYSSYETVHPIKPSRQQCCHQIQGAYQACAPWFIFWTLLLNSGGGITKTTSIVLGVVSTNSSLQHPFHFFRHGALLMFSYFSRGVTFDYRHKGCHSSLHITRDPDLKAMPGVQVILTDYPSRFMKFMFGILSAFLRDNIPEFP
jgi:hypothetical protein